MGIACSMSNILQRPCGDPPVPDPQTGQCFAAHPDDRHPMTWIVDEVPAHWVLPITFDFGDGDTSVSADGEDAHEFNLEGTYTIRATDAEGRTCAVTVEVPAP